MSLKENTVHETTVTRSRILNHCPGDMTSYRVVATQLPSGVLQGEDDKAWVVSFPDTGCSYYIEADAGITAGYVADKFRGRDLRDVNEHTALMMAHAIARVVPGVKVIE